MVSISRVFAVAAALAALVALFVFSAPNAHATRFGVSVPNDASASDVSVLDMPVTPAPTTDVGPLDDFMSGGATQSRQASGAGNAMPTDASNGTPGDPVPLPASVWLLGSGLLVTIGARLRQRRQ